MNHQDTLEPTECLRVPPLAQPISTWLGSGALATWGPFGAALALAIGLLLVLSRQRDLLRSPRLAGWGLTLLGATVAVMAISRHQLRLAYLAPTLGGSHPAEAPQWGNLGLFVVVLVAGLALLGYMLRRVQTDRLGPREVTAGES